MEDSKVVAGAASWHEMALAVLEFLQKYSVSGVIVAGALAAGWVTYERGSYDARIRVLETTNTAYEKKIADQEKIIALLNCRDKNLLCKLDIRNRLLDMLTQDERILFAADLVRAR